MIQTFVIADTDGLDLLFRVADTVAGVSPVYRLQGKADKMSGNPYLVYGDKAAEWTGLKKYDLHLVVAHVRSGQMEDKQ